MPAATTTTPIGTLLAAVIAAAKTDVLKTELPILTGFLSSIEGNASQANIVAQLAALQVDLLASGPDVEQAVVQDVAVLLQQEIAALEPTKP